jgi:hypothetical protein
MKKEQNYILLIMNCKKYHYKAEQQKNTWLKTLTSKIIYYHVVGDESLEKDFDFDDEERILRLKVADDYNSLPKKVIAAYNAVNETFDYKYIFKTDDDQNLVNEKFFDTIINILHTKSESIHYGGNVVDVPQPYLSQYHRIHTELPSHLPVYQTTYCNGRFYFLSKIAILDLLIKKEKIKQEFLEDYAIGFNLYPFLKKNIMNLKTDTYFKDYQEYPQI